MLTPEIEGLQHHPYGNRPRQGLAAVDRQLDILPRAVNEGPRDERLPRRLLQRLRYTLVGDARLPESQHQTRGMKAGIVLVHAGPTFSPAERSSMKA